MRFSATRRFRLRWTLAALAACSLAVTACSAGSLGSSGNKKGGVTLSFMVGNTEQAIKTAQQLTKDFHAAHPDITIKLDIGPGGTELDNLVKTRLSSNSMDDVFGYNSGSLFQQINPQKSLLPITGESFLNNVEDQFIPNVKAGNDVYGVPLGTVGGGGVFYNRKVYDRLGLQVPRPGLSSWPTTPSSRPPASLR
jgi:raffinose/stachyose/melibiose transport system substrate-binding protein